MHPAVSVRHTGVLVTRLRRKNGGVSVRRVRSSFRRYSLRAGVRSLFSSITRRSSNNRFVIRGRNVSPLVMASAAALDPNPQGTSTDRNPSSLANGPLPKTMILGELLGSGTFGDVYRGFDTETQEEVAVKIISKNRQGKSPAAVTAVMKRIEHEVSMWCALQSFSATVRLKKFYEDAERVYFVQELCNGGSLEDLMKIRGVLSEAEVAQIMQVVLSLIAFCHERRISYCDIKPANFILPTSVPGMNALHNSPDFVKVIDFGSCEHVPEKGLKGEKGTPVYMASEVRNGYYGVESDMWSIGVMMFYLLSGEYPFVGKPSKNLSPSALSFYLEHGELKFSGPAWSGVSEEAMDLIRTMLERKVKKRITPGDALNHQWIRQLTPAGPVTDPLATSSEVKPSVSDICPMTSSVKILEETP